MALITKDRIKESTTTTGTGAYALGGADATFDTFASCMSNGDTAYYAIAHTTPSTDEWEVGIATWNTGNTLTRTTVLAGSNGTSAVNFSAGTKNIFMTVPAEQTRLGITATTAELNFTDGVTSNIQTQLDAKQPYHTIAVTVVNSGGNKYALDGTVQQTALLPKSVTVRFDQSDSSNAGHPLRLSTTSDGTHASGSAFSTGVSAVGTPGSAGAYTQVTLEQDAPDLLYTYCTNHSGMGAKVYSGKDFSTLTSTIAELNILDGVTSTAAELNILDGVTSTAAELNILDGVTSTTAELNILDGVTATATELNILDGVTATTAELNYVDGVTSNIQTQLDSKLGGGSLSSDLTFAAGADLITATAGTDNVRLGENAGAAIVSGGNNNVTIGKDAGNAITTGDQITAVGNQAGAAMTTNSQSSFFGAYAGLATTGFGNNFFGAYAGSSNTSGTHNVAMGNLALYTNVDGDENVAIGANALRNLEPADGASYNTAVGAQSGFALTTGTKNTLIGALAGDALTTGGSNTIMGYTAGGAITTGAQNTIMGVLAGEDLTVGENNTALGTQTLRNDTQGSRSVAIGLNALETQNFTSATNTYNTAVGAQAGVNLTNATYNTLIGAEAGLGITTGGRNVAVGQGTLRANTTGYQNVAVGGRAMDANTTGSANIAIGKRAMYSNTTEYGGVCIGHYAGYYMTGNTNTVIGYLAGYAGGGSNKLTSGLGNVIIGQNANLAASNENGCVVIGGYAPTGKGNLTGLIAPGQHGVYQTNNSSSWSTTSDRRLKKNIVDSPIGLAEINQLKVRNFEYKTKDDLSEVEADGLKETDIIDKSGVQVGAIAQEIQTVLPKCVTEESTGVLSVDSDNLTWHLIKAVQELSAKNDALEARIKVLEG